jgi:Tfp pilus assembly protein PilE
MIVVAIIGVLAALASPSFQRYQLSAKAAEALTNLKAIATAQETYSAEYGGRDPNPSGATGQFPQRVAAR